MKSSSFAFLLRAAAAAAALRGVAVFRGVAPSFLKCLDSFPSASAFAVDVLARGFDEAAVVVACFFFGGDTLTSSSSSLNTTALALRLRDADTGATSSSSTSIARSLFSFCNAH